jgi:hypothetical protein
VLCFVGRRADLAPAAIAPLAALVAYFPTLVVPYAYMDDYFLLAWRKGFPVGNFFTTAAQFGRPLHAVSLWATFSLADNIDSLRAVRAVSLVGVILLALVLYYALRRAGWSPWLAAGACTSVVTLGSFQIYVAWAATGEVPYVAVLGGLAWLRLRGAFVLPRRAAVFRSAQAAVLLLLALLTYQPAAMFFWVFAAVDLLRPGEQLAAATRKLAWSLGVAGAAMVFAYGAVRVGVHFWAGAFSFRTQLVDDFAKKVDWFWREPIVNSFGMFGLVPAMGWALVAAVVVAAGIVLLHARSGRAAFGFLGLALVLVPLAYLPNLAVAEDLASYRSIGALASLLAVYAWLGLWGIGRALRQALHPAVAAALAAAASFVALGLLVRPLWQPATRATLDVLTHWPELVASALLFAVFAGLAVWAGRAPPRYMRAALAAGVAAFAAIAVVVAARNVTSLVVRPQSTELRMLRTALASPPPRDRVVFVKPNWTQGAAPLVRYDEFGLPSTYFAWVPGSAVPLVLGEPVGLRIFAWDEAPARSDVDMRSLQKARGGWNVWALHATSAADAPSARRP